MSKLEEFQSHVRCVLDPSKSLCGVPLGPNTMDAISSAKDAMWHVKSGHPIQPCPRCYEEAFLILPVKSWGDKESKILAYIDKRRLLTFSFRDSTSKPIRGYDQVFCLADAYSMSHETFSREAQCRFKEAAEHLGFSFCRSPIDFALHWFFVLRDEISKKGIDKAFEDRGWPVKKVEE